jgi:transcriptional regulator with XRE-family HTH domain
MTGKTDINWLAMTDSAIFGKIGEFIKHTRLDQNKTQALVAREAGINRWTLSQIENGESITLASLIQILRVLDLMHLLNIFTIEETISPVEYAKLREKKRKRARSKNNQADGKEEPGW